MSLDLQSLLDPAIAITREGGEIVMEYYKNGAKQMIKSDASPVTEADLAADQYITEKLSALTPDIPVVTEEAIEAGIMPDISKGTYWLVDPLDGTKEFIKKTGNFAVLVALIEKNRPVLGVGCIPAQNVMVYGANNCGSYVERNGKAIPLKPLSYKDNRCLQRRYNGLGEYESYLSVQKNFPFTGEITDPDFYCLPVIEGKADVFIFSDKLAKEWDIAPWDAILRQAGGMLCNTDGSVCAYNAPDKNVFAFVTMRDQKFHQYLIKDKPKPCLKM